jgi:uncharacterized protein RhaS with RHS repeats
MTASAYRYSVPVACYDPVDVALYHAAGTVLDHVLCHTCTIGAGAVTDVPATVSDNTTYRVDRPDPTDLLHVDSITSTSRWNNGRPTTTTIESGKVTTTTPGGRSVTSELDPDGRPTTVQLPGLPSVQATYDGDLTTSVSQGGRSVTFDYQQSALSKVTAPLNQTVDLAPNGDGWPTQSVSAARKRLCIWRCN